MNIALGLIFIFFGGLALLTGQLRGGEVTPATGWLIIAIGLLAMFFPIINKAWHNLRRK